jgi:hypothetical protein
MSTMEHVEAAIMAFGRAMRDDPGYAWSWHCNLAMMAKDAGADHKKAQQHAAAFMQRTFGVNTMSPEVFEGGPQSMDDGRRLARREQMMDAAKDPRAIERHFESLYPEYGSSSETHPGKVWAARGKDMAREDADAAQYVRGEISGGDQENSVTTEVVADPATFRVESIQCHRHRDGKCAGDIVIAMREDVPRDLQAEGFIRAIEAMWGADDARKARTSIDAAFIDLDLVKKKQEAISGHAWIKHHGAGWPACAASDMVEVTYRLGATDTRTADSFSWVWGLSESHGDIIRWRKA